VRLRGLDRGADQRGRVAAVGAVEEEHDAGAGGGLDLRVDALLEQLAREPLLRGLARLVQPVAAELRLVGGRVLQLRGDRRQVGVGPGVAGGLAHGGLEGLLVDDLLGRRG
jgi:hypothetical protein